MDHLRERWLGTLLLNNKINMIYRCEKCNKKVHSTERGRGLCNSCFAKEKKEKSLFAKGIIKKPNQKSRNFLREFKPNGTVIWRF